jgi:uncharacterized protein YndB with AHSA1/START domain
MLTEVDREQTITIERAIGVPPRDVYRAFTTTSALRDWLCDAVQVDARTGGQIYLWWNSGYCTSGVFTRVVRGESLTFTWRGPDEQPSEVLVDIAGAGEGGASVTVTHRGESVSDTHRRIWESGLEALQSMLETGTDLRIARRPMFGMNNGEVVDPEVAARHNLPVTEGLRLLGLIEGKGAERAGLRVGDVLVALGDREIVSFQDVGTALQGHQAGDRIPATFYRDGERRTLTIELTPRDMPAVPDTVEAVSEIARASFANVQQQLDAVLEGATDAEADYRPASGDWDAKEVLAHLICSERDAQVWLTAVVEDFDMPQPFHANQPERLRALVAARPTLAEIREELRRAHAETLALLADMPAEAVGRKHLFSQVALWLTGFEPHCVEHSAAIESLIEAARASQG